MERDFSRGTRVRIRYATVVLGIVCAAAGLRAQTWSNNRCETCHPMDRLFSHPVNVAPSMDIPDYLPLESGQVTCRTCHEDEQASTHAQARLSHTPMLRRSSGGREFCAQCHTPTERSRHAQHGSSMGLAHLAWPAQRSPMGFRPAREPADQTQLCMSCHDGTLARDAGMQAGTAPSPFGPCRASIRFTCSTAARVRSP
jgi:hypothetical protein